MEHSGSDSTASHRYQRRSSAAVCMSAAQGPGACKTGAPVEEREVCRDVALVEAYRKGAPAAARAVPVEETTALVEEKV